MGTGKSTVADELKRRNDSIVISSDVVRKKLLGIPEKERRREDYARGIYSPEVTRRIYAKMNEMAIELLLHNKNVLLDACFPKKIYRLAARRVARKSGAVFHCIQFKCLEEVLKKRLDKRYTEGSSISDGRWEILHEQKMDFEDVDELSPEELITVDCSKSVNEIISDIERKLKMDYW